MTSDVKADDGFTFEPKSIETFNRDEDNTDDMVVLIIGISGFACNLHAGDAHCFGIWHLIWAWKHWGHDPDTENKVLTTDRS